MHYIQKWRLGNANGLLGSVPPILCTCIHNIRAVEKETKKYRIWPYVSAAKLLPSLFQEIPPSLSHPIDLTTYPLVSIHQYWQIQVE